MRLRRTPKPNAMGQEVDLQTLDVLARGFLPAASGPQSTMCFRWELQNCVVSGDVIDHLDWGSMLHPCMGLIGDGVPGLRYNVRF